jgi:hypothetical protein
LLGGGDEEAGVARKPVGRKGCTFPLLGDPSRSRVTQKPDVELKQVTKTLVRLFQVDPPVKIRSGLLAMAKGSFSTRYTQIKNYSGITSLAQQLAIAS